MSRTTYLTILSILWLNCWNVVPFGHISSSIFYMATIAYMLGGLVYFDYETELPFWRVKMVPLYFILGGIFLSMIPALLYYGQSLTQSFVTYRTQYLWIIVPLLFRMSPSEDEVVKSAYYTTLIMWGVFILRTIAPELIVMDEDTIKQLKESERTLYITGFTMAAIPLYYYLGQMKEQITLRDIMPIIICYGYLFTMQNRSLLFPITAFIGFTFLRLRSKYRFEFIILLAIVAAFIVQKTYDTWFMLIDDTQKSIGDKEYNRNLAIAYYLASNEHPLNYVLGNGFISDNVSNIMSKLMKQGIYNSDVGFLGYWHQFGIIPVITFFWLTIYALIKKGIPYYMKIWSVQILICALTISYFGASTEILFFSYFIYLLYYHKELSSYEDEEVEDYLDKIEEY